MSKGIDKLESIGSDCRALVSRPDGSTTSFGVLDVVPVTENTALLVREMITKRRGRLRIPHLVSVENAEKAARDFTDLLSVGL